MAADVRSAHEVIGGQREPYKTMSSTTKAWIKAMRVVQLLMRLLQLIAATGILVLVILITHIPGLTTWVMRITVRARPLFLLALS